MVAWTPFLWTLSNLRASIGLLLYAARYRDERRRSSANLVQLDLQICLRLHRLANPQRNRASVQTDSCQSVCLHLETSKGQDSCEPHDGRELHSVTPCRVILGVVL